MTVSTDIIHRVWHDKEGVAIDIGPDADALGMVWLRNHDAKSAEYFGKFSATFTADIARAVGEAMIAAADEIDAAEGK